MDERIKAILGFTKGPRVLNLGCTDHNRPLQEASELNSLHSLLERAGHQVSGIDIREDAVTQMRREGYEVDVGDVQKLPSLGEFDTVVAGELIEHLDNPGLFLAGCRRNLGPSGRLILSTPNPFAPVWQLAYMKHGVGRPIFNREHTAWFCPQTLAQLLDRAGFRVETIRFVDDLRWEDASSRLYRTFGRVWMAMRRVMPRKLRSTLVVVATPV